MRNIYTVKAKNKAASAIPATVALFAIRPYYSVDFDNGNSGCQFEVLVNDVPVAKKIGTKGAITSSSPINSCILKSGKQQLKIKLYPNIGKTKITTSQENNSPFSLTITFRKDAWDQHNISEVTVFKLPPIKLSKSCVSYFEKEFDFQAQVPYHFEGWSNSKNLAEVAGIGKMVVEKYEEIKQLLIARNYIAFLKLKKRKDTEMNASFYLKSNEVEDGDRFDREAFTEKDAQVQPFNNVKVVYYGNGKLVALENTADKGSALKSKIKHIADNGKVKDEVIRFPVLLHMPANSNKLEIIR
ncbi:hypothetical protein [Pedobacter agri]|uniref:hypothetical protein n=1 Tax=Pedobacter agri TaxID=454586 RepID=UPI00292D713E|nr:hypothetical protein [Pedobacter agri]